MSTTTPPVEQFINDKVQPEFRPIVTRFRQLIKTDFPEIKEEMRGGTEAYYGVPVYRYRRIIISLSPTKQGITFAFSEGKKIHDSYNLLEGLGNKTLNLRVTHINEFNPDVMRDYITQAIALDKA